ncbi:unnamed protein product [Victoria cruziana]
MGRSSWGLTIFTQLALCGLLCIAFLMGRPQEPGREEPLDVYFMSISGGQRPLKHQINLLKQMEKLVKSYNVKFVISISEHGDEDSHLQNVRRNFPSLNIPWYCTKPSQGEGHLAKQITIPYGNTLDIVFIDTGMLKDKFLMEHANGMLGDQQNLLMRTLSQANGNWRIVVGYHPLIVCQGPENTTSPTKTTELYETLHHALVRYGIDMYLTNQAHIGHYVRDKGITYVGNPEFGIENYSFPSENENSGCISEAEHGFLLHRVSPLEIESYFIDSKGKVVFRSTLHQRGKEVI